MTIEELNVYQQAMEIGEEVWEKVLNWDSFAKKTVGQQLVRAVDSVAANLSEGFGRFHYKENKNFCYYARGSLFETKTWLTKAFRRQFISQADFNAFTNNINDIGKKLNNYINSIGHVGNKNKMKEDQAPFGADCNWEENDLSNGKSQ